MPSSLPECSVIVKKMRIPKGTIVNRTTKSKRVPTSKFRGVHWHKRSKTWMIKMKEDGVDLQLGLGSFDDEYKVISLSTSSEPFLSFLTSICGRPPVLGMLLLWFVVVEIPLRI